MGEWSRQFEQAYHLTLPSDLRAWFDSSCWREPMGAEFCEPLHPEQLLSPTHNEIWAGFMPPDLLPLIGNDYGDWLCLRISADDRVREVVRWSHAGGDWQPYGASLSEALLFDAALRVTRQRKPEFTDPELPHDQLFGAAQWAWEQLALPHLPQFWTPDHRPRYEADPDALFQALVDNDVAVPAACAELAWSALQNTMRQRATPAVAAQCGQTWNPDFIQWMFDTRQLPDEIADKLKTEWNVTDEQLQRQDWDAAEGFALQVLEQRRDPDLGGRHRWLGGRAARRHWRRSRPLPPGRRSLHVHRRLGSLPHTMVPLSVRQIFDLPSERDWSRSSGRRPDALCQGIAAMRGRHVA